MNIGIEERIASVFDRRGMPNLWVEGLVTPYEYEEILELQGSGNSLQRLSFYDDRSDVLHLLTPKAYAFVMGKIMRAFVLANETNEIHQSSLLAVDSIIDWLGQPICPELLSNRFISVWGEMTREELSVVEDWLWYAVSCKYLDDDGIMMALEMVKYLNNKYE